MILEPSSHMFGKLAFREIFYRQNSQCPIRLIEQGSLQLIWGIKLQQLQFPSENTIWIFFKNLNEVFSPKALANFINQISHTTSDHEDLYIIPQMKEILVLYCNIFAGHKLLSSYVVHFSFFFSKLGIQCMYTSDRTFYLNCRLFEASIIWHDELNVVQFFGVRK